MQIDFLAIGELLADIITIDYCTDLSQAETFKIFPGGSPANVAANLKFLGKEAGLISCIGEDGIGKMLLQNVQRLGLPVDLITIHPEFPSSIVLVSRSKDSPEFIAYRGADSQLSFIDPVYIDSARIIHTTAFALSKKPAQDVVMATLLQAKSAGKQISVDWNFSQLIWGNDDGKGIFEAIAGMQPLLKISMDDMERFFGCTLTVDASKQHLDKHNFTFVCLTCGKDGVWYKYTPGNWQYKPAPPVAEVIDTTGAGDAFWAGFIGALLDNEEINACVDKALHFAARKIQKQGPLY